MNNENVGPHFLQTAEIWESDSKWHWTLRLLSGWFIYCWKRGIEVPYNDCIVPISLFRSLNTFHIYLGVLPFDVLTEHFIWLRFLSFLSVSVILVLFSFFNWLPYSFQGLPWGLSDKESTCYAGDPGSVPGAGRSPGEGNGNPLQSCRLGNPIVHGELQRVVMTGHREQQFPVYTYSWFTSVFIQHCGDSWLVWVLYENKIILTSPSSPLYEHFHSFCYT